MSLIQKYISIKLIMDDVLAHPLLEDLSLERAVNYAVEFIRIVGMPLIFTEKTDKITIDNYRGLLPCDYLNMIQVRDENLFCFRYSTDDFHFSNDKKEFPRDRLVEPTYKIQGNFIYTSIKKGEIEISYESILLDKDGFPLIPDNSSFIKALELYIKKQWFTILFDLGKITLQSFNNTLLEYSWYVGQAQSDLVRPTIDQMESITNMWNTLVPRVVDHRRGFKHLGDKEYLRIQR